MLGHSLERRPNIKPEVVNIEKLNQCVLMLGHRLRCWPNITPYCPASGLSAPLLTEAVHLLFFLVGNNTAR